MKFKKQIIQTLWLSLLVFILPLLGSPSLIFTWPIFFSLVAGFFLNLTQPPIPMQEVLTKTSEDRYSLLFIFISGILIFLIPVLDYGFGRQARPPFFHVISWIGLFLVFGGLAFRYWSIRVLGKFFTARVEINDQHQIVTDPPYRWIRHPSYLGSFAMSVGVSILFRSYIGILFCFLGFFPVYIFRISVEEKALREKFGQAYEEYSKKTWKLIPIFY